MARVKDNLFTKGSTGKVGKDLVFKKINGKTFMCQYPDMSEVEFNSTQIKYQDLFALGIKYAKSVLDDPARKSAYNKKIDADKRYRGRSVYHFALQCFMKKYSRKVPENDVQNLLQEYRDAFPLTDRQAVGLKYIIKHGKLTNSLYQQVNKVSKSTATRDLHQLVKQHVITTPGRGAGAVYTLIPLDVAGATDINSDDDFELI